VNVARKILLTEWLLGKDGGDEGGVGGSREEEWPRPVRVAELVHKLGLRDDAQMHIGCLSSGVLESRDAYVIVMYAVTLVLCHRAADTT